MFYTPNYDQGRSGQRPVAIVLHTMVGTLAGCDNYFASKGSAVSAHYGIGLDGTIHQYVREEDTAWANGLKWTGSSWQTPGGVDVVPTALVVKNRPGVNPNLYTISIEHEGNPDTPVTKAMWDASVKLARDICERWNITKDRLHIIGHYQINPVDRPDCPGPRFDIGKYVAAVQAAASIDWLGDFRFCAGEGNDPAGGATAVKAEIQYQPGTKADMLYFAGKSFKEVYPPR